MTNVIPVEADFDNAPTLLDGAANTPLTLDRCDLKYWFASVAQGTFRGRARGYADDAVTPDFMREPGPLREALRLELSYRALDEEVAVRVLAHYVAIAPDSPELEFFTTQVVDECRHHMVFRDHLVELGVPRDGLMDWVRDTGRKYQETILNPVSEFALTIVRDEADFVGAVAAFAIIIEGILAAAAELSERKWGRLDPITREIARGASIDEIRHLTVGSSIVREHLLAHPDEREHILSVLRRGREMWNQLSDREFVMERERLFQEGMVEHTELLSGYEVFPGRPLLETTPEERWEIAAKWNDDLADARLEYMGIPEAIDLLRAQAPRIV